MDYEFLKNWILEIAGLITAVLIILNFINPIIKFLKICYGEFKKNIPFVLKKDYRSLQNELEKTKIQLVVEQDHVRSLSKKSADYERTEWKDGILYHNGLEICSRCYDTSPSADRKIVRLLRSDHEIKGIFYCPECKTHPKTTEGARQQMNKYR